MLRAVADTNIYISALISGGIPEKILLLAKKGELDLYISVEIGNEIEKVLFTKFKWSKEAVDQAIDSIFHAADIVNTQRLTNIIIKDDPSDDRVLECALACYAHVIITGDKHLLRLNHFQNIEIMKARNFIDYLKLYGL